MNNKPKGQDKAESPVKDIIVVNDKEFEFKTAKDMEKFFDENPKLRDEFLQDSNAFIDKYKKQAESAVEEDEEKAEKAEEKESEKKEKEEIDGQKVFEEKITAFEKDIGNLSNENKELKNQIKELMAKKEETKLPPKEEKKIEKIIIPVVPEIPDEDLISEEGQQKYKAYIKAVKAQNEALVKKIEMIENGFKEHEERIESISEKAESIEFKDKKSDLISDEFDEIDKMRKANKLVFGEDFGRKTKAIEDDYIAFIEELGKTAGIKESLYKADGTFSDAHIKALDLYYDEKSERGKELRSKCEKIKLPEDIGILEKIYEIRNLRNAESPKDGNGNITWNMPYNTAADLYKARNPKVFEQKKLDEKIEAQKAKERAKEKLNDHAKETPTSEGANIFTDGKITQAEMDKIVQKLPNDRTKEEKDLLKQFFRAGNVPEEEITVLVGE